MYANTCSQLEKDENFVSASSPSCRTKEEKEQFLRAGLVFLLILSLRKSNCLAKKT